MKIQCGIVTEEENFRQRGRSVMGRTRDVFGLDLLGMWQWACKQQKNSATVGSPRPSEPCESRRLNDLVQRKISSPLSMVPRKEPEQASYGQ